MIVSLLSLAPSYCPWQCLSACLCLCVSQGRRSTLHTPPGRFCCLRTELGGETGTNSWPHLTHGAVSWPVLLTTSNPRGSVLTRTPDHIQPTGQCPDLYSWPHPTHGAVSWPVLLTTSNPRGSVLTHTSDHIQPTGQCPDPYSWPHPTHGAVSWPILLTTSNPRGSVLTCTPDYIQPMGLCPDHI